MSADNFNDLRAALAAAFPGQVKQRYGSNEIRTDDSNEAILGVFAWHHDAILYALSHNQLPALLAALDEARAENDRLIEVCFGAEGIRADGELGLTKENWSAWLTARDERMKRLGAAEWLEANNERLDTMNRADVETEAAMLREGGK